LSDGENLLNHSVDENFNPLLATYKENER